MLSRALDSAHAYQSSNSTKTVVSHLKLSPALYFIIIAITWIFVVTLHCEHCIIPVDNRSLGYPRISFPLLRIVLSSVQLLMPALTAQPCIKKNQGHSTEMSYVSVFFLSVSVLFCEKQKSKLQSIDEFSLQSLHAKHYLLHLPNNSNLRFIHSGRQQRRFAQ